MALSCIRPTLPHVAKQLLAFRLSSVSLRAPEGRGSPRWTAGTAKLNKESLKVFSCPMMRFVNLSGTNQNCLCRRRQARTLQNEIKLTLTITAKWYRNASLRSAFLARSEKPRCVLFTWTKYGGFPINHRCCVTQTCNKSHLNRQRTYKS